MLLWTGSLVPPTRPRFTTLAEVDMDKFLRRHRQGLRDIISRQTVERIVPAIPLVRILEWGLMSILVIAGALLVGGGLVYWLDLIAEWIA